MPVIESMCQKQCTILNYQDILYCLHRGICYKVCVQVTLEWMRFVFNCNGWWFQKYLMHRIHAILRVITLSLGLHAMRYIRCSRSRTGPHHTVNWAWWWVWSRAGAHDGPWGQTCPRRGTWMGHSTCCVWRGGHLPNWWEKNPHSLR